MRIQVWTDTYPKCFFNFLSHQAKNNAKRSGERVWDQWRFHLLWSEVLTLLLVSRVWQPYISLLASIGVSAAIVTSFWKRSPRLVDVQMWHDVPIGIGFSENTGIFLPSIVLTMSRVRYLIRIAWWRYDSLEPQAVAGTLSIPWIMN